MNEKAKESLNKAGNICLLVKENSGDEQTSRYMSEAIEAINEAVSSSNAPSDAAALREALESCLNFIVRIDRAFNPFMHGLLEDAVAKAKAALAAPPRNYGRFDDYHDAVDAWHREERCLGHHQDGGTCEKDPLASTLAPVCFARWLFATAKGEVTEKGGAE